MQKVLSLYKKYEEIINYLIVGFLTVVISLTSYYLCVNTFLNPNNALELQIANVISWILSVTFAYFTNRSVVFKSKSKNIGKEIAKFFASRVATLLIDMLFMYVTVSLFHGNDKIMKIITNIVVIILNYIFSKIFVFKK